MKATQGTCVFALLCVCAVSAWAEKKYKSEEEYNLYTAVTQSFAANDMTKALASLDAWKGKFPESDYASDRQQLYVQAYARAAEPAKAVEAAKPALAGPFNTPDDELRLLFAVVTAVQQIASPLSELQPVAADAARRLIAFDKMPSGMKAEDWAKAKEGLQGAARVALVHVTLTPVREAVKSGDCAGAEAAGTRAVQEFPESVQASWVLASAQLCLAKKDVAKFSPALYSLARAAALDPVKGLVDPAWQKSAAVPYFEKMYTQYHGADAEGLQQLKQTALKTPLPPEGFAIASQTQLEQQKQAELESKSPELALWMRVRSALAAPNGESYFAAELKDAAVPPLSGTLVEAKPACRPTQLTVAMAPGASPEVVVKLRAPLTGKPEPNSTFRFEAVPTAFTREPFQLTMETDPAKVSGLKSGPCAASKAKK